MSENALQALSILRQETRPSPGMLSLLSFIFCLRERDRGNATGTWSSRTCLLGNGLVQRDLEFPSYCASRTCSPDVNCAPGDTAFPDHRWAEHRDHVHVRRQRCDLEQMLLPKEEDKMHRHPQPLVHRHRGSAFCVSLSICSMVSNALHMGLSLVE